MTQVFNQRDDLCGHHLRHFTEVSHADISSDALVGFPNVLSHESESIGHGQQREEFILLRLEVQDLGLWLSAGQKLKKTLFVLFKRKKIKYKQIHFFFP